MPGAVGDESVLHMMPLDVSDLPRHRGTLAQFGILLISHLNIRGFVSSQQNVMAMLVRDHFSDVRERKHR